MRFDFSQSFDRATIQSLILAQQYLGTGTATASALNVAEMLLSSPDTGYRGGKAVTILVTDGQSQETGQPLTQSIEGLHAVSEVFAIGLGHEVNIAEIEQIASTPTSTHIYRLDFHQLNTSFNVLESLAETAGCPRNSTTASTTITTTSTTTTTTTTTSTTTTTATSTTTSTPAPLCSNFTAIDFVLVLDSSGSIGLDNWDAILHFASSFVELVPVGTTSSQFVCSHRPLVFLLFF